MITSNRKFGVEIEFTTANNIDLTSIARKINVVHDGSLSSHQYAGEYVSPILAGKRGENRLDKACSILKQHGAIVDLTETSVHIHLDGRKDENKLIKTKTKQDIGDKLQLALSLKVDRETSKDHIRNMFLGNSLLKIDGSNVNKLGDIVYFSKAPITRVPKKNYVYYSLDVDNRFEWLQRVFYFYTKYSEQISNMVSNSRKEGNMYCIPLRESYDLDEIKSAKNLDQLANVWYKQTTQSGRYNDSRYHDVNLHSFFHSPGTIEIRSHGGTTDVDKILLWVKLHQFILDKLETISLSDLEQDNEDMNRAFLDFIEDDMLKDYIKRVWGYFHRISIQ
jgi:hypothetical protein